MLTPDDYALCVVAPENLPVLMLDALAGSEPDYVLCDLVSQTLKILRKKKRQPKCGLCEDRVGRHPARFYILVPVTRAQETDWERAAAITGICRTCFRQHGADVVAKRMMARFAQTFPELRLIDRSAPATPQ